MKPLSCKTELKHRTLWYDGHTTVAPHLVLKFLLAGMDVTKLHTTEVTPEVDQYNRIVSKREQITIKTDCEPLSFEWDIPEEYKTLNIPYYLGQKLAERCGHLSDEELARRVVRLSAELKLYKQRDLYGVLRAIIFVINTLTRSKQIWGVGRGSSVSSFVLYVIGVHDVDSVKYGLDVSDFLK